MAQDQNQNRSRPDHNAIAVRAYEIWVAEGRQQGAAAEHWHRAERELGERAGQTQQQGQPRTQGQVSTPALQQEQGRERGHDRQDDRERGRRVITGNQERTATAAQPQRPTE